MKLMPVHKSQKIIRVMDLMKILKFNLLSDGDLNKEINKPSIYQIGYELVGIFDYYHDDMRNAVHICGEKEFLYLNSLEENPRKSIINRYFNCDFPLLIIAMEKNNSYGNICNEIVNFGKKHKKNILKSNMKISETIRVVKHFLLENLAEEVMLQDYMFLEIYGIGVLITGYEQAKIGVTLELIERGHRLITDDNIIVKRLAENELEGYNRLDKSLTDSHFFILNKKDKAKIDITTQFGIKATRNSKKIDIMVELEEWNDKKFYDRLGIDEEYEEILGEKIPRLVLPVRRGRNLAVILETAAVNTRLKKMGESSAEYFVKESKRIIEENKKYKGDLMKKGLPVKVLKSEFALKVLEGEELLDKTFVTNTTINRPILSLSGFTQMYEENIEESKSIQIFSNDEFTYLNKLTDEKRKENLDKYFKFRFPLLLLTVDANVPDYFLELVRKNNLILCRSPYRKSSQLVANFNGYLETYFSPTTSMHGVFVEVYGFGVLITGKSGIGKSETALELIHRGHRLIADDLVKFSKDTNNNIIGKASTLPYFMEIRGLGIIDIKALYGLRAVRIFKRLDLIIELKEQENDDYLTAINYEQSTEEILERKIKKIVLYISSGRNAAAMAEIAVMNVMAMMLGHDPNKLYKEGLGRLTAEERKYIKEDE
ncbi:HPr(Ser) kinase/phosphatase [Fusobacterium sp. PH5-44]|uniref:HPr(Ser) kinase/phosphatase n=1 Tax=unclassified Fusobacterium TaxID=2648384 RepID=UPI003D1A382B